MRVIKKYSNRRLYDTSASRYVNLDELGALVRAGEELRVLDAATGADLTRPLLLQVLIESAGGAELFPVGFLHRVIRTSGDAPAHRAALQQLSVGLELLDGQITRFERQLGWLRPDGPPPVMAEPQARYHASGRGSGRFDEPPNEDLPPEPGPPEAGPSPSAPQPAPAAKRPRRPPAAVPAAAPVPASPPPPTEAPVDDAASRQGPRPSAASRRARPGDAGAQQAGAPPAPVDDELEAMRQRLASLEGRLRGGRS